MSTSIRKAAEEILETMQNSYNSAPAMVSANEINFHHLDLNAYHSFSERMRSANFKLIGDLEIPGFSDSSTVLIEPTMLRNVISRDGYVLGVYYQTKPNIGRRIKLLIRGILNLRLVDAPKDFIQAIPTRHYFDFETEFKDGRQLITSNAEAAGMMSSPPSIEQKYFPYDTPTKVLFEHHMMRFSEITKEISPISLQSIDDVLQMQKRQSTLKIAYRNSIQWILQQEMQSMSGGNTVLASDVFSEIKKIIEERQGKA